MTRGGRRGERGNRRGGGRAGRDERRLGPPAPGLFRDILLAPDRETIPDARPLVSFRDDDDEAFLAEVRRRRLFTYELARRGVAHGTLAELRPEGLVGRRPRRRRREAIESERWHAARPILLPGAALSVAEALDAVELEALRARLAEPAGLAALLAGASGRLAPDFELDAAEAPLFDPERDVARAVVRARAGTGEDDAPRELWLKAGRLSTHPADRSLRLRVSFGVEGDDDASADEERHALVAALAARTLPGAAGVASLEELWSRLATHAGHPVHGTQHIAYWNAPNGGARFHHDAFAEDAGTEGGGARQLGVVYAQLTGRTVWLALSIEELGTRLRELVSWIEEGDAPELRAELGDAWEDVRAAVRSRAPCLAELARPDAGVLAPLASSPELTAYLADAGHVVALHPGDVLVLPNHGLARTAMHSVFCGSSRPGYALSLALRARSEAT